MVAPGTPGAFIPHDTGVVAARPHSRGGLNDLILLSGIVLFVASVALAVGVFLYGQFLQTQTTSKLAQLKRAEDAFEPSLIEQITRLDDRMHAADLVLGNHLAPTAFFQALGQATLQTVSFDSLHLEAPDAQHITITMQGIAQSVNSVALQAELFSKNGVIVNPIFSNIARQPGGVHFDLSAGINPAALNFRSIGTAASAGAAQGNTENTQTPAASTAPQEPFGGSPTGGQQ